MNRIDPSDQREINEIDLGYSQADPASITQDDVNRLVFKIAAALGVINGRTFLPIEEDTTLTEEQRTLYSNVKRGIT